MRGKHFKLFSDELPSIQLDRNTFDEQRLRVLDRGNSRDRSVRRRSTFSNDTFAFPNLRTPNWDRLLRSPSADKRDPGDVHWDRLEASRARTPVKKVRNATEAGDAVNVSPKTVRMKYEHSRHHNDGNKVVCDREEKRNILYGHDQGVIRHELLDGDRITDEIKPKSVLQQLLDDSAREAEMFKRSQDRLHPKYYKTIVRRKDISENSKTHSPLTDTSAGNRELKQVENDSRISSFKRGVSASKNGHDNRENIHEGIQQRFENQNRSGLITTTPFDTSRESHHLENEPRTTSQNKRGILKRNKSTNQPDFPRVSLRSYTPLPKLKHCDNFDFPTSIPGRNSALGLINARNNLEQYLPRAQQELPTNQLRITDPKKQRRVAFNDNVQEATAVNIHKDDHFTDTCDEEVALITNISVPELKEKFVIPNHANTVMADIHKDVSDSLDECRVDSIVESEPTSNPQKVLSSDDEKRPRSDTKKIDACKETKPQRIFFRKEKAKFSAKGIGTKRTRTPSRKLESKSDKVSLLEDSIVDRDVELIDTIMLNSKRRESILEHNNKHIWKEVKEGKETEGTREVLTDRKPEEKEGLYVTDQIQNLSKIPVAKSKKSTHVPTIVSLSDATETSTIESFVRTPELDELPDFNAFYDEFDFNELPDVIDRSLLGEELIRAYRFWDRRRKAFPKGIRKIEPPTNIPDEFYPRRYGNVRIYKIRGKTEEDKQSQMEKNMSDVVVGIS